MRRPPAASQQPIFAVWADRPQILSSVFWRALADGQGLTHDEAIRRYRDAFHWLERRELLAIELRAPQLGDENPHGQTRLFWYSVTEKGRDHVAALAGHGRTALNWRHVLFRRKRPAAQP